MQVALVEWLRFQWPDVLFTIAPNGMKLSIGVAVKIKRMGYNKGTPDIEIFEPRGKYHGLFIELKTPDGVVSPDQRRWETALVWRGYMVAVCRSINDAQETIETYLNIKKDEKWTL